MTETVTRTDQVNRNWEQERIELAAKDRHAEMRDRLRELGRSEEFVRSLALMNSYAGFERLVAETDRYESEQESE